MKDYYSRLGLDLAASSEAINNAIQVRGQALPDAGYILLDKRRRTVYDRNLVALRQIGYVRGQLGLSNSPHWSFSDFTYSSIKAKKRRWPLLSLLGLIGFLMWMATQQASNPSTRSPEASVDDQELLAEPGNVPTWTRPSLALPPTAQLTSRADTTTYFEILTPSGQESYYIKVVDSYSDKVVATGFARPSSRLILHVPLGSYLIRYAIGESWYGVTDLFGPAPLTAYFEADETFLLQDHGDTYDYYQLELIKQYGGNLREREIDPSEF